MRFVLSLDLTMDFAEIEPSDNLFDFSLFEILNIVNKSVAPDQSAFFNQRARQLFRRVKLSCYWPRVPCIDWAYFGQYLKLKTNISVSIGK